MPRAARATPGGFVYHVMNRASGFQSLFESSTCYREFLEILRDSAAFVNMRILAHCVMPNHWHLLLWPRGDDDVPRFVHRLTAQHGKRWRSSHGSTGRGTLYQGRYRCFVVRDDRHLLIVTRYIERNPVRAGLVVRARDWPWSSAAAHSPQGARVLLPVELTALPLELPANWDDFVDDPQSSDELARVRHSIRSNAPFGGDR